MPGAGSWGRPWEAGFFSGLVGFPQEAEVTHGLAGWAQGLTRAPDVTQKVSEIQKPKVGPG